MAKTPAAILCTAALAVLTGLVPKALVPAAAADLGQPAGEVVLTVTGDIAVTNLDGSAVFDRDMLRALPVTRYETGTIWTEGTHVFEGVLLGDLLEALGARASEVRATAINDYSITIPVGDGDEGDGRDALVAYHMDGKEMSVRNKGPLWIVYPYDSDPAFRTEMIYARSIWQLDRLDVR